MIRHRYRKDAGRDGMCTCGQGRAENVHQLMSWKKSSGFGYWYSGIVHGLGVTYRVRTRLGIAACWWPEVADLSQEQDNWRPVSDHRKGVSLAEAKAACEAHRAWQEAKA